MSLSKKRKEGIEIPLNKRKKTLHYEANTRKLTSDLNSEIKVENEFDNLFEEEEADLTIKEALQDIKLDIFDEDLDGFGDELACQTERLGNCDHKSDTPSISVEKTSNMKKSPKVIKIIDKQKEALKLIQIALMKFESVTKDLQELVEFDIEEAEADLEDGLDSSSTVQIEVNDISPQYMDNCLKDSEAKVEDINEGSNPTIAQTKETKSQQKHHSISVSHSSETVCENEKQTSSPASLPNSQKNQKLIKKCSSTKNTCSKLPCVVLKNIMDEKSSSKFTKSCNEHDGIISDTDDNDASDNAPEDRSEAVISSLGENHLATLSSRIEDSQPSTSHESYDDEISGGCNFNPISEQNNETAKETSFEEEIPQTSFKIDGIEKPTEGASEDQIRGEGAVNIEPNPPQKILKDIESQSIKSENIDVSDVESVAECSPFYKSDAEYFQGCNSIKFDSPACTESLNIKGSILECIKDKGVYNLPNIPRKSKLFKALNEKRPLTKSLRSCLLDIIYEDFKERNQLYIGHQYAIVASKLLEKYPYLQMNLEFESAQHMWIKSLRAKFNNEKCRADKDNPLVIARKMRKKQQALKRYSSDACNKDLCPEFLGVPHYHPLLEEKREDDKTIAPHELYKLWMIEEYKKSVKNFRVIELYMNLTFNHRRSLLFNRLQIPISVQEILQQYPCFKMESQALEEVNRLFGGSPCTKEFLQTLPTFAYNLARTGRTKRSSNSTYVDSLFNFKFQIQSEIDLFLVLAYMPLFLSEDPKNIIGPQCCVSTPYLEVAQNKLSLKVDNICFISDISPLHAALLWTASFLFFNIDVPDSMKRTFLLLHMLIFKIPSKMKITPIYTNVIDIYNASCTK